MALEQRLSNVLSEFARTLVTDFPIQAILDHLVLRIVEVMPVTSAGVTLISDSLEPRYIASSDESALRYEKLQTDLEEGPCLAAYKTSEAVAVPDLRNDAQFPKFAPRALEAGLRAVFTFPLRHGDDTLGALDLYRDTAGPLDTETMVAAQTLADVATAYLLNAEARADLRASADQFRERSLHDPLTGLPNRVLLRERLQHAVLRARRSKRMAAILFADLDRFKQVNDIHGHQVGDDLLVAVSARLTSVLRPGDTLARMSGDEFVILCEDLDEASRADALANRIAEAMEAPFLVNGLELRMTASVGIAFAGRGDDIAERVLEDADAAMYQAKRQGGAHHHVVDLRHDHHRDEHTALEADLHGAAARGELRARYQPIVRTNDGLVTGVEALMRWAHPRHGQLPPRTFMPSADHASLSSEIEQWMLEQACDDRRCWLEANPAVDLDMTVNVSVARLMAPNFCDTVERVLDRTDTEPQKLTLDITQTVFLEDGDRALVVLHRLKRLGVALALDDFGSGFSCVNFLKRFPIDVVKLDQHVVADLDKDSASAAVARAIVDLAHALNLAVIAEGVETAEQHRRVVLLGCESAQGFYFAQPTAADDILRQVQSLSAGQELHCPVPVEPGRPPAFEGWSVDPSTLPASEQPPLAARRGL